MPARYFSYARRWLSSAFCKHFCQVCSSSTLARMPISVLPQAQHLFLDHGSAIGLDLAMLIETEPTGGEEINSGQEKNGQEYKQKSDPVESVKVQKAPVLVIGRHIFIF